MDLRELLEAARDAGVVSMLELPASDVRNDDRVDGFDWDAYPHVSELV